MDGALSILRLFTPSNGMNLNSLESKRMVVTRLKFISSLQPNEKIDTNNLMIESNNIFTPLKRLIYGESRKSTMQFFSTTIDRAMEVINAHLHSKATSDKIFCANVIQDLIGSVNGLRSVQKTYGDDKLLTCELETIIEQIQGFIYGIQESSPDMFTIKDLCVLQLKNLDDTRVKMNPPGKHNSIIQEDEDDDKMP